jgi:Ca2+-binding EF-hand superfamily protein
MEMEAESDAALVLRARFNQIDTDGTGKVDTKELGVLLARMGKIVTPENLEQILSKLDTDGDGELTFDEFRCAVEVSDHW